MTDRPYAVALAVGGLLLLGVSGCAAPRADGALPTVPMSPGPTQPMTPGQTVEVLPPPPPVRWSDDGESLHVTTYGSSSCPSEITAVTAVGDRELRLDIGPPSSGPGACSADLGPTTYEVPLPGDVPADEGVTVHLRYESGEEETVVLPPAGE